MNRGKWSKRALAAYFVIFLIFLYGPIIVMTVLSFQGLRGRFTFPLVDPGVGWYENIFNPDAPLSQAPAIKEATLTSLYLALGTGFVTALLALSLSMAFRRRFRGDSVLFVLILLCLMTPGFLLAFGTALFWQQLNVLPGMWKTALGTNVIWALPFGFLVMVAIWNRYDRRIEEAARDLGANARTTFREVTLPLIWTGLLGAFLFGFTLSWNEFDRTSILLGAGRVTLPTLIFGLTTGGTIRPNLYALGTVTTFFSLSCVALFLVAALFVRRRGAKEAAQERQAAEAAAAEELGEVVGVDTEGPGLGTSSSP
jgi:putative spermidine/putrescine transport system permease protein